MMLDSIALMFSDYTFQVIMVGTAALGAICGVLGSFAVLRKQSLLGDAISHAALPGIVMAFLFFQVKDNSFLLVGALISGVLGSLWVNGIVRRTHLKTDTALGIVLSVFFGFGMLLLTYVQKQPNAVQAGLDKYLFGQAATLMYNDVKMLILVLGIAVFIVFLFWKELKLLLFDADYALTVGINTRFLDVLITVFIVMAIVLGLQTVGVVLMSAMLLAPAAAARQWTNSLGKMLFIAALFCMMSGGLGTVISASQPNLSTGPVIVVVAISLVLFSFVFAPQRGLLSRRVMFQKNKRELKLKKTLLLMYSLTEQDGGIQSKLSKNKLFEWKELTPKTVKQLYEKGWIKDAGHGTIIMTEKGRGVAEQTKLI